MQSITAEKRDILGKKTKNLRKKGILPAVLYGKGESSESISVKESDFLKTFEIVIQSGAILSVVVLYWKKLLSDFNLIKKIIVAKRRDERRAEITFNGKMKSLYESISEKDEADKLSYQSRRNVRMSVIFQLFVNLGDLKNFLLGKMTADYLKPNR